MPAARPRIRAWAARDRARPISTPRSPRATMSASETAAIRARSRSASGRSIFATIQGARPPGRATIRRRSCSTCAALRTNERPTKSTPAASPPARSRRSFAVSAGAVERRIREVHAGPAPDRPADAHDGSRARREPRVTARRTRPSSIRTSAPAPRPRGGRRYVTWRRRMPPAAPADAASAAISTDSAGPGADRAARHGRRAGSSARRGRGGRRRAGPRRARDLPDERVRRRMSPGRACAPFSRNDVDARGEERVGARPGLLRAVPASRRSSSHVSGLSRHPVLLPALPTRMMSRWRRLLDVLEPPEHDARPARRPDRPHVREIIRILGLNPEKDPNLVDTDQRVAKMYLEIFSGLDEGTRPKLTTFPNDERYTSMVMEKEIPFYSMCAHHFVPVLRARAHRVHPERADRRPVEAAAPPRVLRAQAPAPGTADGAGGDRPRGGAPAAGGHGRHRGAPPLRRDARRQEAGRA